VENEKENNMEYVVEILQKAEYTLMKKISKMKDGSPRWTANERLRELRSAISLIKTQKN
jgi:hypothetical protein